MRPLFVAVLALAGTAQAASPEALKFFETKVRPLLVENCQDCHGPAKHKGGLRVDNLPYLIQGGEQGPAVVPHKPANSLLIKAVSYTDKEMKMPPDGKLSEADIATLGQWISMGAPWPEAEVAKAKITRRPGQITDEDRQWWSFQPVKALAPPTLANKTLQPIDAFIRARLEKENLQPSPPADRAEIIRRVSFDITGLPPTPERLAAFIRDDRPDAYERLVDELLASPRYGERWAQHWLDLVRYAESEGYRLDAYRPNAWAYRDYVIRAFNTDKPYNQFMREQIAGDEIAPGDNDALLATGYLRHTIYEYNQRDAEGQWRGILNEVTDVTADVFLGVSVQCAQCHDHKFDPILQKDYYRLQAFLTNITWPEDKLIATPEEKRRHDEQLAAWEAATVAPRKARDDIIEPRIQKAQVGAMNKFPDEVQAMWRKPIEQRTPREEQIVQLAWRQAEYERYRFKTDKIKEPEASVLAAAESELANFAALKPKPLLTGLVIGETGPNATNPTFKSRRTGTTETAPGFLTILDPTDAALPARESTAPNSGRRTVLADWLARPDNPLTTRVIVNRVWQHHFGKGLAASSSDLGRLGEKPTHPELLDWLTSGFVKSGWSLKWLHKQILLSQTYRQTSRISADSGAMQKDPENRLLWRFTPRRLDAEQARDAALMASGELDLTMGGEGVGSGTPRRSVYTKKIRNTQDTLLASLDAPAGFQSIPERQPTTTATQSLLLINGDWPLDRARAMAKKIALHHPTQDEAFIQQAYLKSFSRLPSAEEARSALDFISAQSRILATEKPPPPPVTSPLVEAQSLFGDPATIKVSKALALSPGSPHEKLRVKTTAPEPEEFSIEAIVHLKSLYPDGSVRTIVSRWNNDKQQPGWALGITSEKSAYKPNNLVMQLSGEDFQGSPLYEAVPSNIRIQLNKPYYIAAIIRTLRHDGQPSGGSVTFYARDLSDPAATLQTATTEHHVTGSWVNPAQALYVGGRNTSKGSLWDGAIARVSLRSGALDPSKLMTWAAASDPTCIADIAANNQAPQWQIETSAASAAPTRIDPTAEALTDFCHTLLNANEFFYLQ